VARARTRYAGELRAGVLAAGADADAAAREALADAARAARAGDQPALAAARGAARAALLRGAYAGALAAAGRTDAAEARSWLLLRDFRTATRFTRAGADATEAVAALEAGRLSPRATRAAIAKDLLDAYQARLRELLDDARSGIDRRLPSAPRRPRPGRGLLRAPAPALRRGPREPAALRAPSASPRCAAPRRTPPRPGPGGRGRRHPRRVHRGPRSRTPRPPAAPSSSCASSPSCPWSTGAASTAPG
jgi:high-affinity iron transporter